MLRSVFNKILYRMSNTRPDAKKLGQMADKIQAMNETMSKTSPKVFSIFMMLTTLPTFYFGYKMIVSEYKQESFTTSATAGLTYINIKNVAFFFCLTALSKLKFNSPTAKHTLPKVGIYGSILPPLLALISLCLPPSDNKYIVFPTFVADLAMLVSEAQMANFGIYPFWLYSYRHYIRFLDWILIISTFVALRNLQKRVKSHPHEFTQTDGSKKEENLVKSPLL